jgi:LacI family purine nucleotide synthesis repressor
VDGKTIPLVYINRRKWDYECNYVLPDDYSGVVEVMHYLFQNGHRKIGYFAGRRIRGRDPRYQAYEDSLRLAGLEVFTDWVVYGEHFEIESGHACMQELLKVGKLPTAVLCYSDNMAAGAMRACQERGIRIPEDVSFVGGNDDEICRVVRPNLTTLANPIEAISSLVVRTLFDLIREGPGRRDPVQLKVPMRLVLRDTVRRIR